MSNASNNRVFVSKTVGPHILYLSVLLTWEECIQITWNNWHTNM